MYDPDDSDTYIAIESPEIDHFETWHGIQLKGYMAEDSFGLTLNGSTDSTMAELSDFFVIKRLKFGNELITGYDQINGYMGLALPTPSTGNKSYITKLAEQGKISKPVFSLLLTYQSKGTSSITLGDYNPDYIMNGTSAIEHDSVTISG